MAGVYITNDFEIINDKVSTYSLARNNFDNFKGVLGFGFIRKVEKIHLKKYLAKVTKQIPDFKIKTFNENPLDSHFIIESIEPLNKNLSARGVDVASEKNRREASILAMKSGKPTLTEDINLVQTSAKEIGFLFYLPVYKTAYIPKDENKRVSDFVGWAYAPILMSKIFEDYEKNFNAPINFQIIDITNSNNKRNLLSIGAVLNNPFEEMVEIGQRRWLIRAQYVHDRESQNVRIVSFILFFMSAMLFTIFIYYLRDEIQLGEGLYKRAHYAEEMNTIIIKNTNLSIITTTTDGLITTFNSGAEKMLGYESKEVVGLTSPAIFHEEPEVVSRALALSIELGREVLPGFEVFVIKALKNGSDSNEWTYIRKDRSKLVVRLSVSLLYDKDNDLVGYVGIAEDISEQKKLFNIIENQKIQLIQNTKMTSLGEMAGGVAHEINTPLTVIFNKSKKMRRLLGENQTLSKENIEDLKEELLKIESTVDRIAKIISGLKTFSRNSDNDKMIDASINKIIDDTLSLCQERFKFEGVLLEIDNSRNRHIRCRPSQISQVLLNLLINALDALNNVEEKWVKLKVENVADTLIIEISNGGGKIPLEIQHKLMDPFFTTKEVGKGTGLGLSISKGIIEEHGGKLYFDRTREATTFIINLPLNIEITS